MPRKKPDPENAPKRATISLPAYIMAAADWMKNAEDPPRDLSAVTRDAIIAFAKANHPHLLDQMKDRLRAEGVEVPSKTKSATPAPKHIELTPRARPEEKRKRA